MMKFALKLATALAALVTTTAALAAPYTLTNANGSFANFSGFDWAANGQIDGFAPVANSTNTFTAQFYARAISATELDGTLISGALTNLEYTIFATINGGYSCGAASCGLSLNSASWAIYYDTAPETGAITVSNATDGVIIASGSAFSSTIAGSYTFSNGKGSLDFFGPVTYTNGAYILPVLDYTDFTSTLQINYDKADGNQLFVPEPASLALLGFALAGMAGLRRRKA